ncbi:MAG TPA: mycothiol synthase [Pseudonocardiaceae bacterium]|nr:mycothiol synthase [Pseudonocardiaceae bacterium]
MPEINWRSRLTDVEAEQLLTLLAAASAVDGRPNFDPADGLPGDFRVDEYGLASEGAELVGVVTRNTAGDSFGRQVAELIVHPDRRRKGVATALLAALLDRVGPAGDGDTETLRVWAHGDHPAAAALAARFDLRRVRELRRMRLTLTDLPNGLPEPRSLPNGVRVRPFRIGADEQALVEVNHRAFAWHPEQGALSVADVEADEAQPWFDPAGFFLAVREDDDTLLGFHWTKVHQELDGAGAPMGEVYVVGVDPSASGHGLGSTLTLVGLRYLADRGCRQVMLYVESDNAPAIAVYSRLGFSNWDADVQYAY